MKRLFYFFKKSLYRNLISLVRKAMFHQRKKVKSWNIPQYPFSISLDEWHKKELDRAYRNGIYDALSAVQNGFENDFTGLKELTIHDT